MFHYVPDSRHNGSKHPASKQQSPASPWCETTSQINHWRQQSQMLWLLYGQFPKSGSSSYQDGQNNEVSALLQSFCQALMEYLSTTQFQILEKIAVAYQKRDPATKVVWFNQAHLFNQIATLTDIALDFNSKYTEPCHLNELASDLSLLGEGLAKWMDWEEKLAQLYSYVTGEFVESLVPLH